MRLHIQTSILFLCDIQDKFAPLIHSFPTIVSKSTLMLESAKIMNIPALISEQYPSALGSTVNEILSIIPENSGDYFVYPKKKFSMITPEALVKFESFNRRQVST